ncbi:hypothetical protein X729_01610 [Mesorhizobium sp. L103C131B0]|nr:hypothetical protein X729_01610 [Mesorhizobium sp. L103C131B0]
MDGGVEPLAGEVEAADAGDKVDGDVRVFCDEIRDQRHQPARAEGRQYGEVQHAAMPIAHQSERGVAQLPECRPHGFGIDFARRGQPNIAAVALEQPAAELFLQKGYLTADGPLGQIEFLGGSGEGAKAGHGLEGGKGAGAGQKPALDVHDPLLNLIDR